MKQDGYTTYTCVRFQVPGAHIRSFPRLHFPDLSEPKGPLELVSSYLLLCAAGVCKDTQTGVWWKAASRKLEDPDTGRDLASHSPSLGLSLLISKMRDHQELSNSVQQTSKDPLTCFRLQGTRRGQSIRCRVYDIVFPLQHTLTKRSKGKKERRMEEAEREEATSQLQGIQQLLQAKKRAAEKVSEAHKRKNRRLKQAKEAAQAETEQYLLQREKEFKAKEAAALGSHGSCSTEVEKETQEKMTILQAYFQQNRDEVLDNLLAFVCDIRAEIHENYRING
ncbi:PREDICTED: uncharacterized protein LOC101376257 [Odobenus rosmarus divergens]|uniref:Uncharacterized protein LOC101376257 n=1 Tax=Odobenus rosmarus divergens TaxID=9708 RepID=A0A2U3WPS1_ODORO|nr:PREDICTED: uncharacterized protein LOC101376257 [Odobenus rosmarus divergens]